MRYVLLAFLFTSCDLLPLAKEVASDPEVVQAVIKAGSTLLSDEVWGGIYALAGVASLVVGKWTHARMKRSAPGEIIGSSAG